MNKNIFHFMADQINKLLLTACLIILALTCADSYASASPAPAEITFLTWQEYIDKEVVAEFESKYNAKVNFVYFESDDTRNQIVMNTAATGYDLLLLDSANIAFYKKLGWITPFNAKKAPNINYVQLPELANLSQQDPSCVAYSWGTTGVAFRKDLVSQPISSWQQIFSPTPELYGKILMSSISNEVVGMALKSLGYSMGSTNNQELEEARQLLLNQAPAVAGYSPVATDPKTAKLVTGEVSVTLTYSGDALILKALEPQIEYIVPQEGGAIWADYICLSAKANNSPLAHQFINFINRPEQAAKNALFTYMATPNVQAEKLLPAAFINNPIIYPNKAFIAQSEVEMPLSPRAVKKHNAIMIELKKILQ